MQQAAEAACFLAAGKAARQFNISRMAWRGTIIPARSTPGGFAHVAGANVAAYCFLRRVTLQRPVPTGSAGISPLTVLPAYRCRQDADAPSGYGWISAGGGC